MTQSNDRAEERLTALLSLYGVVSSQPAAQLAVLLAAASYAARNSPKCRATFSAAGRLQCGGVEYSVPHECTGLPCDPCSILMALGIVNHSDMVPIIQIRRHVLSFHYRCLSPTVF